MRVPNSWPNHTPVDEKGNHLIEVPGGFAGLTGPATSEDVRQQVSWAAHFLRSSKIDVIASGAVMDCEAIEVDAADQIREYLHLGAVAAAGTTFFYENPDWREATDRLLRRLVS